MEFDVNVIKKSVFIAKSYSQLSTFDTVHLSYSVRFYSIAMAWCSHSLSSVQFTTFLRIPLPHFNGWLWKERIWYWNSRQLSLCCTLRRISSLCFVNVILKHCEVQSSAKDSFLLFFFHEKNMVTSRTADIFYDHKFSRTLVIREFGNQVLKTWIMTVYVG